MRRRGFLASAALALALAVSGCSSSSEEKKEPPPAQNADERVIRGWNDATNAGDFRKAGGFFAPGAIVEQVGEVRLPGVKEAAAFSASLPCRAELSDLKRDGRSIVAAFNLSKGRRGGCPQGGGARVRFVIRGGKIREWRQLPEPAAPRGETA